MALSPAVRPHIAVSVVTMGTRPRELEALLASVAKQDIAPVRVVIVGNGTSLPPYGEGMPGAVTVIETEENLGCPGGRNVAIQRLRECRDVDVVVELDDDGLLVQADVLRRIQELYAEDPQLGIVGFRIVDEEGGTAQRHVPRLGRADPTRRGLVTGFLGGGHAFSLRMLDEIGDWPGDFFFTHELTCPPAACS